MLSSGTRISLAPRTDLFACVGLFALILITFSAGAIEAGFYEDDYSRIPHALEMSAAELIIFAGQTFADYGIDARPLHSIFIYIGSAVGFWLAGLDGIFVIAVLIVLLNAWLVYALLVRVSQDRLLAFYCASFFVLFPADTTHLYLNHALGIEPAMTFLLMALHLYYSRRLILAYLAIVGALLCYEPMVLVFVAAPLLHYAPGAAWRRRSAGHAMIIVLLLLFSFALRYVRSNEQLGTNILAVAGVEFALPSVVTSLALAVFNTVVGPLVSLLTFAIRPIQLLWSGGAVEVWFTLGSAFLIAMLAPFVIRQQLGKGVPSLGPLLIGRLRSSWAEVRVDRVLVFGGACLVLAYPLTITTVAIATAGRATRVHSAAALGASIVVSLLCVALHRRAVGGKRPGRMSVRVAIAALIASLAGSASLIGQDYALMWQRQRQFWSDLIDLVPDLSEGIVIAVDPAGLPDARLWLPFRAPRGVPEPHQIKANAGNLARILEQLYIFPDDWEYPPRVYRMLPGWRQHIRGDQLRLTAAVPWVWPESSRLVPLDHVVLLNTGDGRLTRARPVLTVGGESHSLKAQGSTPDAQWEERVLYDIMIKDPGEPEVPYLVAPERVRSIRLQ